ncbi:MAG TPA: GspH/FimT family pseudopilin [Anaerolineales bacterium]|nr:GspH/FimT family pseudopilin [Pseudomonadales bacterium]HNI37221.1 GspH/FimT family pseudopilin [Pseudomonadales bacterium]HNO94747.1 GspH/FimT family pseudopilin [Anaerolineales bacterium]
MKNVEQGFTLIELLTTVTMLAILVSLAAPSFNSNIRDNRVLTQANSMIAAVANARSEALKRGRMVSICPSSNGTSCGADWSQGWMVYVEKPTVVANGAPDPEVGGVLLVEGAAKNMTLAQPAGNKWIRFSSRGLAEAAVTVTVKPSTCNTGYKFQSVAFAITGRATLTKSTC